MERGLIPTNPRKDNKDMAHSRKVTVKLGQKSVTSEVRTFGGDGHTSYSGYGSHGKDKKAKARDERRRNRQEARTEAQWQ